MVTIYNTTLSATSQRHFSDSLGGGDCPKSQTFLSENQKSASGLVGVRGISVSRGLFVRPGGEPYVWPTSRLLCHRDFQRFTILMRSDAALRKFQTTWRVAKELSD